MFACEMVWIIKTVPRTGTGMYLSGIMHSYEKKYLIYYLHADLFTVTSLASCIKQIGIQLKKTSKNEKTKNTMRKERKIKFLVAKIIMQHLLISC